VKRRKRKTQTKGLASLDIFFSGRVPRIRSIQSRITKLRTQYNQLSKNPKTFSYTVAFGNPGGCMSKPLRNRIDRWHEKLKDLSFEEGKLKTHILILKGSPLTDQNKRDYIYFARWGTGTTKKVELDEYMQRAIQDAPQYVQKAYRKQHGRKQR